MQEPANGRCGRLAIGAETMDFDAWINEIQQTVTFVIEPDDWRKYYDAQLSPLDAIAQHQTDEDV